MEDYGIDKVSAPIVLLIDGQCNLCSGIARFVIRRDSRARFRFASLQSDPGQRLLAEGGLNREDLDTFVMVDNGRYYTKSTAALRTCGKLGLPWSLAWAGLLAPRLLRDRVYDFIAKRRYRWFGRPDRCLVPTPDVSARFLEGASNDAKEGEPHEG
ncbi:thiol-disulfide oxidoreductase DCC family protein [Cohnella boryungensis]|uniref:Thiol-disulfide oxidoreductase DCC family protein n=1 Tax=Cohnella boryungensis TaxID=768479 RepID=A0ABV8SEG6_9BACL